MKILLAGGGSGGPVSPLLAVAKKIKEEHPQAKFLLVGTKNGPEGHMAEKAGISFLSITNGKWRRYFSWQNFLAPILVSVGFFQSLKLIKEFKPDCVFGTGSFVQVPIVWAAWFKGVPVVLHQQDVVPGLANKLCQFCANKITVTFPPSVKGFYSELGIFYKKTKTEKIVLTGNPFREELKSGNHENALRSFGLSKDLPVLLVLGGGTGSEFLNSLIAKCAPKLSKSIQIIHSTGKNKSQDVKVENYHQYEFIDNMADAYACANIVVCRAGASTITELSNLKKVGIIVPMPETHQEFNAALLVRMEAGIVLSQSRIKPDNFVNLVRKLLFAGDAQEILQKNIFKIMPHNANSKIADVIVGLAEKNK